MSYQRKLLLNVGKFHRFLFSEAHYRITGIFYALFKGLLEKVESKEERQETLSYSYKVSHNLLELLVPLSVEKSRTDFCARLRQL